MPSVKLRWPRSLRWRLLAVYGFGMALSALLAASVVMLLGEPFNRYMLKSGAIGYAEAISRRVEFGADGMPTGLDETRIERWAFTSLSEEVKILVTDTSGKVHFSSAGSTAALAPDGSVFAPQPQGFALVLDGVPMHAATVPLTHQGTLWYVQFAASDRLVLQMRQSFGMPALVQGMIAICLTFLVVFLVTTHLTLMRMLKPLRMVSQAAQCITPQTLDARLDTQGLPDEITPLVDAFNRALERLHAGFQTQQDFLANAAHELKTPLALIRAQIELEPSGRRNPHLIQDVDRIARQVQQLLHLAEASEPRNYKIEPIDPRSAVAEACSYMDRVAERSGVQICVSCDGTALGWRADRGALFTLFKNLLENAIQHSPAGGVVTLKATSAGFVVADQGPGVTPQDQARLFQRFWRSPERRDIGAGLGLSICEEIARAHHWRIEARPGVQGLEVHVLMSTQFWDPMQRQPGRL